MGKMLTKTLNKTDHYRVLSGYARHPQSEHKLPLVADLPSLFRENDIIVDFSSADALIDVLEAAKLHPKPLIICSTGWTLSGKISELIDELSKQIVIVIAPNTSLGACLQLFMVQYLAKALPANYDIDVHEKHHQHKKDIPSGTAKALIKAITDQRLQKDQVEMTVGQLTVGPRPENMVATSVQRSGKLPGEHEVSFTHEDEQITVNHTAFSPNLFAKGTLTILNWIDEKKPVPGIYSMLDVVGLAAP